jgi:hypothetical protein
MNDITLLREAGPEAPPLRPEVQQNARVALLEEIRASAGERRRFRLPSPKVRWRISLAVTTAAAAWTAAVVIAAPDGLGPPPGSVTLVGFEAPTFPLSPDPVPAGMTPAFSGDGDQASFADYRSVDGEDRFTVGVSGEEPERPEESDQYEIRVVEEVSIGGREAQLVRGRQIVCPGPDSAPACAWQPFVDIRWERSEARWVQLSGEGRYGDPARLAAVAASLVDRPQEVTLSVGLAPAGWSIRAYKDGRILTLVNDSYEQQTLNVFRPLPEDVVPADRLLSELMGPVGPVIPVTVNDRPAQLVQIGGGPLESGWYLQAQFPEGTTFVVQAPAAFTQDEVLRFAGEVTYSP